MSKQRTKKAKIRLVKEDSFRYGQQQWQLESDDEDAIRFIEEHIKNWAGVDSTGCAGESDDEEKYPVALIYSVRSDETKDFKDYYKEAKALYHKQQQAA